MHRLSAAMLIALLACGGATEGEESPLPGALRFGGGDAGWLGGASDYPVDYEPGMGIVLEPRASPGASGSTPDAFYTFGKNNSDDLFLFIKRRLTGLQPGRAYQARFCAVVEVAGSGRYMYAKAGATAFEPVVFTQDDGTGHPYYVMNVDKGVQANPGPDALQLGYLREGTDEAPGYVTRTLCTAGAMTVSADATGAIWIFVGAESVFEVVSEAYWVRVDAQLVPR